MVAKGFTQKPGINFNETFALVAKIEFIRLLCMLAASLGWEIHVIDINSAFLNSDMPSNQHAYVKQPLGFEIEGLEDLVWELYKALYGLKQAGYLWYKTLWVILTKLGFQVSRANPYIFFHFCPSSMAIITSHVDNLGLYVSCVSELKSLKEEIMVHISFKD